LDKDFTANIRDKNETAYLNIQQLIYSKEEIEESTKKHPSNDSEPDFNHFENYDKS
jgi:hypothetical protein